MNICTFSLQFNYLYVKSRIQLEKQQITDKTRAENAFLKILKIEIRYKGD